MIQFIIYGRSEVQTSVTTKKRKKIQHDIGGMR